MEHFLFSSVRLDSTENFLFFVLIELFFLPTKHFVPTEQFVGTFFPVEQFILVMEGAAAQEVSAQLPLAV